MSILPGFTQLIANRLQNVSSHTVGVTLTIQPTDGFDRSIAACAGGVGGQLAEEGVDYPIYNGTVGPAGLFPDQTWKGPFNMYGGYDLHDVTTLETGLYVSLQNSNSGHLPTEANSAWWLPLDIGVPVVPDTSMTLPPNISLRFTVKDANGVPILVRKGIQPTGPSFNLDTYVPNVAKQALVQYGPPGPDAYEVYVGTLAAGVTPLSRTDWLLSLKGNDGQVTDATLAAFPATDQFATGVLNAVIPGTTAGTPPVAIGTSGGSTDNPIANYPFLLADTFTVSGALKSVSLTLQSYSPGTSVKILIANQVSPGTFQVVDFFDVTFTQIAQTFVAGIGFTPRNITAGQFLGYFTAGGGLPAFDSSASGPGYWVITTGGDISQAIPWNYHSETGRLDLSALVQPTGTSPDPTPGNSLAPAIATQVTDIAQTVFNAGGVQNVNANRTQLMSESFAGSALPLHWVAGSGAWTVNAGLLSPTSGQGYGCYAYFIQQYSIGKRTSRIIFEVLASGTILGFGSVSNFQETNAAVVLNSLIVVDGSANTLAISNAGYQGSNPGVLASGALGFGLSTGVLYVLTIAQNEREMTVTLADPVTGLIATVATGNNSTDAAINSSTPAGINSEYPVFVAVAGRYKVHQFTILANTVRPRLLCVGDSITWGSYVTLAQRWATLLTSQVGPSAVVSGRPGGTSYGVLARMTSEVQFLKPDYIVVMIGTNDSFTYSAAIYEANLQAIVTAAQGYGCKVILCTIPTNASSSLQSTINTFNTYIRGLTSQVTVVRVDLATSLNHDGVTQDASLFVSDGTHPNAAGGAAIARRFQIDAPFLFD